MKIKNFYLTKNFKINDFDIKLINKIINNETIIINRHHCFIKLTPDFNNDVLRIIVLNENKHDIFTFNLDFNYYRENKIKFIFAIKQFVYNYIK